MLSRHLSEYSTLIVIDDARTVANGGASGARLPISAKAQNLCQTHLVCLACSMKGNFFFSQTPAWCRLEAICHKNIQMFRVVDEFVGF